MKINLLTTTINNCCEGNISSKQIVLFLGDVESAAPV